jgi:hypothetical protein
MRGWLTENPAMTTVISEKPRIETRWNQLEHIKIFPTVLARTGDFETIRKFVTEGCDHYFTALALARSDRKC